MHNLLRILILLSISFSSTAVFSQTVINLANQCNCEVLTAPGIPTPGSPVAIAGNLYVDSNTGLIYSYDGTDWIASVVPVMLTGAGATSVTGTYPNFTISSTDNVNDADAVIGNEYNTNATLTGTTLNIIDGGGTESVNLSSLVNDADAVIGNEYNTGATLTGTTLIIVDGGGATSVDLSPLQDGVNDADAVIGNEYNTNATLTGTTLNIIDGGGSESVNLSSLVNDADAVIGNEYNTNATLTGTTLNIVDGGGTESVNLSSLVNDADAVIGNEYNTGATLTGTTLNIMDGGGSTSVNLSALQDGVNDADAVIGNEYNTNATLTGTTLNIIDGGGSESVNLSSLVNDADAVIGNEYNTSAALSGTTLNIVDGGGTKSVNLVSLRGTTNVSAGSGLTGGGTGTTATLNVAANNGLNVDATADRVQLGGALTEGTTITHAANTLVHNLNSTGDFLIRDNNTAFFAARDNGRIGIGTEAPSYTLHVIGRVKSNGINETSDVRYKKDVTALGSALDKIMLLRGVNYKWKTDEYPDMEFEEGIQLGIIAQEIEKVFPEVVHTDEEGYKSVEYSHLVPVLIEGVKDVNTQVQSLYKQHNAEISQLKAKNKEMEAQMNSILELLKAQK